MPAPASRNRRDCCFPGLLPWMYLATEEVLRAQRTGERQEAERVVPSAVETKDAGDGAG